MICQAFSQLYILGNIESPMHTQILEKYGKFRRYFNVSMNYRRDADIKINTFGSVVRVRDHPPPGPELDKIIRRFGQENKHMASKENKVIFQNTGFLRYERPCMFLSISLMFVLNSRRAVAPTLLSLFLIVKLLVAGKQKAKVNFGIAMKIL